MMKEALAASPLTEKRSHFPAKAKHCAFLFMNGGPSQVDTFDPKPALTKHHGKPYTGEAKVGSNGRTIHPALLRQRSHRGHLGQSQRLHYESHAARG